jgi:hypothetical protein
MCDLCESKRMGRVDPAPDIPSVADLVRSTSACTFAPIPKPDPKRSLSLDEIGRRFGYRPVTMEQVALYSNVTGEFRRLAELLSEALPGSRESSLAFTALEEALSWSRKAIYRDDHTPDA